MVWQLFQRTRLVGSLIQDNEWIFRSIACWICSTTYHLAFRFRAKYFSTLNLPSASPDRVGVIGAALPARRQSPGAKRLAKKLKSSFTMG